MCFMYEKESVKDLINGIFKARFVLPQCRAKCIRLGQLAAFLGFGAGVSEGDPAHKMVSERAQ